MFYPIINISSVILALKSIRKNKQALKYFQDKTKGAFQIMEELEIAVGAGATTGALTGAGIISSSGTVAGLVTECATGAGVMEFVTFGKGAAALIGGLGPVGLAIAGIGGVALIAHALSSKN